MSDSHFQLIQYVVPSTNAMNNNDVICRAYIDFRNYTYTPLCIYVFSVHLMPKKRTKNHLLRNVRAYDESKRECPYFIRVRPNDIGCDVCDG